MRKFRLSVLDWNTCSGGDLSARQLESIAEVTYYPQLSKADLFGALKGADGVICNRAVISEEVLKAFPDIKYLGALATGYNNFDGEYARLNDIPLTNVPAYSTDSVAQLVFSFILNDVENTDKFQAAVSEGKWQSGNKLPNYDYPIRELKGKTIGIFGYGNIGKKVAAIADAFSMKVLVCTRTKPENCQYEIVEKDELFSRSDFITLHCPLTAQTQNIVNERTLSLMKKSAVLINTSRGGAVDEKALAFALNNGVIRAAYLDVLREEPMNDCPLEGVKNCMITPHIAWCSQEARARLIDGVAENFSAFLNGRARNVVNGVTADKFRNKL